MSSFYNSTHRYCDQNWGFTTKFGYAWEGEPYVEEAKIIPARWSKLIFFCSGLFSIARRNLRRK